MKLYSFTVKLSKMTRLDAHRKLSTAYQRTAAHWLRNTALDDIIRFGSNIQMFQVFYIRRVIHYPQISSFLDNFVIRLSYKIPCFRGNVDLSIVTTELYFYPHFVQKRYYIISLSLFDPHM
jgi:hypothetical protein